MTDPRLQEHPVPEDAIAYLHDEISDREFLARPSLEDRERHELLWWQRDSETRDDDE